MKHLECFWDQASQIDRVCGHKTITTVGDLVCGLVLPVDFLLKPTAATASFQETNKNNLLLYLPYIRAADKLFWVWIDGDLECA